MRRLVLFFVVFSITSAAFAQVSGGSTVVVPPIAVAPPIPLPPISFDFSNSVVDQSGNVLIFDESFYGVLAGGISSSVVAPQTHVAVVSADGKTVSGYSYSGSLQILGVGQNAVYAVVNTITGAPPKVAFNRQLVALRVLAGTLPSTLPSINLTSDQEVKLSPGSAANAPDTIALISGGVVPVATTTLLPTPGSGIAHVVLLYTCDGTTFTANKNNPISTAGY